MFFPPQLCLVFRSVTAMRVIPMLNSYSTMLVLHILALFTVYFFSWNKRRKIVITSRTSVRHLTQICQNTKVCPCRFTPCKLEAEAVRDSREEEEQCKLNPKNRKSPNNKTIIRQRQKVSLEQEAKHPLSHGLKFNHTCFFWMRLPTFHRTIPHKLNPRQITATFWFFFNNNWNRSSRVYRFCYSQRWSATHISLCSHNVI